MRRKTRKPHITQQQAKEVAFLVLGGMQYLDTLIKAEVEATNARIAAAKRATKKAATHEAQAAKSSGL